MFLRESTHLRQELRDRIRPVPGSVPDLYGLQLVGLDEPIQVLDGRVVGDVRLLGDLAGVVLV
ncbi:hypothetical protein ACFQAS_07950 [Halopenitus salinus]|uniref:Uncharacterized protein n=1 Tax=Halopenitus salinus TaxID=1198295 RepID=A0ABD5V2E5_9EURY